MQRGLDRVFRAAEGVAGGSDLNVIAGQEVHGEAADFLAGVVGDGDYFAVLAFLSSYFSGPSFVFSFVGKTGKTIGVGHTGFPINTHRHSRQPAQRGDVTATTTAPLISTNDVDSRLTIDTKAVDRPVRVVDRFKGAGLSALHNYGSNQTAEGSNQHTARNGVGYGFDS